MSAIGFRINDSKGFHIRFENGWTVSVQFGPANYCDNYDLPIGREGSLEAGKRGSATAEIAAWDASGKWHDFKEPGDEYSDTVKGRQTPNQVLAFMSKIAAMPAATEAEATQ